MAVLDSCPKPNMVAYLEKTDGNTEFHKIISFLTQSSIHYALIVIAGKPVSISEASIRSDLLFDDADGIDSLPNQAIFDAIKLMGYEGDLTVLTFNKSQFSPQWRFLFHTMNHCISSKSTSWNIATALKNVPVPLDYFPINALTSKVFSLWFKKGKPVFMVYVTPLFDSMLVQPTEDEGETLERQSEPQPIPSPPHLSTDQHEIQTDLSPRPSPTTHIPDSIPEGSGGNHGDQAKEIKPLKAQIKKLKKKAKPVITHHKAWMKSERKPAKAKPTVHNDPAFDELDDDTIDYMETEDAQDVGRTSYVVHEEKESAEKGVSTEDPLSTAQPKVSTDKPEDSTDKPDEGTDKPKVSTDKEEVSTDRPDEGIVDQNEGRSATQTAPTTTTPTIFGDDETIAQVLIIMSQNKEKLKEKEKGVELKDVEETERPRPTLTRSLLTLKPLPKIDLKDKGKKMIEEEDESDTDSEDITEAKKKFKQLARDEEVARKARLNINKILAENLQEEEREMYTIKNKPPSRNQLRNQMMTYLKHVGGKKHSDLNTKGFEEIKALYDKIKRFDDSFIAIGSAEDEKVIKEMNEQVTDASKKRVKKDDNIKGEIKEEEGTRKRKLVSDEDKEVDYEILDKKYPIIEWRSEYLTTKPQYDETAEIEDVYLNVVIRKKKYPLKKEVLSQLLKLKLETDEDSTSALKLIRFVKKKIAELEPEDSDGDEKDL
ncbi:hypothetical protein Tco_1018267 [Tanacetum coccineum]|uniref:Uncharacterized protein n=1 Tax=Tanacetum coccineum TaxID=301880 RepID=A0ABQ5FWG3_9ASTR